ncbi:MAG: insulinase family protein [Acidobacteriia bacterium]|nr:insulinase family protein [Terriglobia bacterium]
MRRFRFAFLLLSLPAWAQNIDIPFQKFVLPNGLTLIVHEDHKAPIVAVNVWYHVGSKNERPGKTGFAHLFEHLMFGGSEHFKGRYIDAMERIGATNLNGTTSEDRTNYFETVPVSALDYTLWMESDRMGYMVGAIDQQTLDLQRGVVQNEKRQGENEPYGLADEVEQQDTYPAGHPYSWSTIGSMDDLNAASLTDVKTWFQTYYGPANAVLSVAGDVDAQTVRQKVEKYFGEIPPGPPVIHQRAWVAKMSGSHRAVMQDRVPQARVDMIWNIPEYGSEDADNLDLVSDLLAVGKTSRLYKRLVYDDQIATNVAAYLNPREIGGQFEISAMVRPGVDVALVEKAIDEEMARFLAQGPTEQEVNRVRTQYLANFVRGIDQIGGFGGTSDVLAQSQTYLGDPAAYKIKLDRVRALTPAKMQEASKRWLSDGVYTLDILPFGDPKETSERTDRSKPPEIGRPPEPRLPQLQRLTLANGLKVVLAERHEIPLVNLSLLVDSGFAADQFASPGTARLTQGMLDGGTKTRASLEISEQLAQLGARLTTAASIDTIMVRLSSLKTTLDAALSVYADVVMNPIFPESDFRRQQRLQLSSIEREKATPVQMGLRVLPGLIYGKGHAYAEPFTGTGTPDSVSKLTRDDLLKFHATWFKPNHSTLVVVGDTTLAELRPELEKAFAAWKPGDTPKKSIPKVAPPAKPVVYLVDRPGSQQSLILAGNAAPPTNNPDEIPIVAMNDILGADFGARINMNLREDKHWSYGAQTLLIGAVGQRPFLVYAPVQTDKTKESLEELSKELRGIRGDRPATAAELTRIKNSETLRLPGSRETIGQVAGSIEELVEYGLPDNYYDTYASKIREVSLAEVAKAASEVVEPDHMVWVVVGDRAKIEEGVRALGLGEVKVLNPE